MWASRVLALGSTLGLSEGSSDVCTDTRFRRCYTEQVMKYVIHQCEQHLAHKGTYTVCYKALTPDLFYNGKQTAPALTFE
jgi:hypothetical protein